MGSITTPGMTIGNPVINATAGSVLFAGAAGVLAQDNTNFNYTTTAGPRLQIGSSGVNTGIIAGYSGTSGTGALWASTTITPNNGNYSLALSNTNTSLNAPNGSLNLLASNSLKVTIGPTAGLGPAISAGTATTAVSPFAITQTWNNAAITFPGLTLTITDTASAAGSLAMQILGGAAGTTNLAKLSKAGSLTLGADIFTNDATYIHRTTVALTDSAAAQVATLTNAPVAGNPTKWITIDDNGTPRSFPVW